VNEGRMSEYAIRALDASTWDAFARLAEKHNGMGFGGCWCTWFHSREGRPEGETGRPWQERLVREGNAHAALVFDGDAAVAWCQYGSPEELPRIYHRKEWEAGLTGSRPPIASRASSSTGTIGGKASQPWRFVEPSTLIAEAGGGVVEGYPHDLQGERSGPNSSTAPRAASSRRSASAMSDPRERRIA
jgi:hypothetical protein